MDNVQGSGLHINFKVKFSVIDSVYGSFDRLRTGLN
jgi:hypothetical protein